MSRSKKTRRITDIMPARKNDKFDQPKPKISKGKKPTRYELDLQAREAKKSRKHKGKPSGSRTNDPSVNPQKQEKQLKDPRIGSRKKIPLVVEFVNQPEKGKFIPKPEMVRDPALELEQLENNECLNQLLDELDAGKTLSKDDQAFVDDCLARIEALMDELGIGEEDVIDEEEALLRQFEHANLNDYR